MSVEKEKSASGSEIQKLIEASRGLPNLGGIPDINVSTSLNRKRELKPQAKNTKNAENPDKKFPWGIYSAINLWIDGKIK